MTDKEQELVEIKKAISKILNGGQSYRIGNRTMTRADLKTLYDMQTKVENEIAESEKGDILGRNASAAVFDRR